MKTKRFSLGRNQAEEVQMVLDRAADGNHNSSHDPNVPMLPGDVARRLLDDHFSDWAGGRVTLELDQQEAVWLADEADDIASRLVDFEPTMARSFKGLERRLRKFGGAPIEADGARAALREPLSEIYFPGGVE